MSRLQLAGLMLAFFTSSFTTGYTVSQFKLASEERAAETRMREACRIGQMEGNALETLQPEIK